MFWRLDCDGGDECKSNLARSAAFVLDVKPGGDVHSILSNPYDLTCFIPSKNMWRFGFGVRENVGKRCETM